MTVDPLTANLNVISTPGARVAGSPEPGRSSASAAPAGVDEDTVAVGRP